MPKDSIQDSTRYVVSEQHYGNIMPGNKAELLRDVFLLPGAEIKGGVFAHELVVEGGNVKVEKAVYASKSIIFNTSDKENNDGVNVFESAVVASDALLMENEHNKTRFKTDIYCNKLNLKNSIVYGNIIAGDAIINNCIVLGGIYCTKNLQISNSIYGTFGVNSVTLGENLYQLLPVSLSDSPISLNSEIKALTFFNLYEKRKSKESGVIEIDEDDILEVEKFEISDSNTNEEHQINKKYCLSIAERVLSADSIVDNFEFNRTVIETLALGSQLKKESRILKIDKPMEHLEKYLWSLLHTNLPKISGKNDIKSLIENILDTEEL